MSSFNFTVRINPKSFLWTVRCLQGNISGNLAHVYDTA